jgi:hypothetical protein
MSTTPAPTAKRARMMTAPAAPTAPLETFLIILNHTGSCTVRIPDDALPADFEDVAEVMTRAEWNNLSTADNDLIETWEEWVNEWMENFDCKRDPRVTYASGGETVRDASRIRRILTIDNTR